MGHIMQTCTCLEGVKVVKNEYFVLYVCIVCKFIILFIFGHIAQVHLSKLHLQKR